MAGKRSERRTEGELEAALSEERRLRGQRILDAAAALLVRFGFRKTTIDDVAREAGVGKGTIYLHWKDKNELFQAALWRASRQSVDDMIERVNGDPEGGRFHRMFAHGMVAVFANPLLAAIMTGKSELLRGLLGTFDAETLEGLVGNSTEQIERLKAAGLIRDDIPVNVVVYLIAALKVGIISAAEFTPSDRLPSTEQITNGLAELIRRWLEPDEPVATSSTGKQIISDWMENLMKIGSAGRSTEE